MNNVGDIVRARFKIPGLEVSIYEHVLLINYNGDGTFETKLAYPEDAFYASHRYTVNEEDIIPTVKHSKEN